MSPCFTSWAADGRGGLPLRLQRYNKNFIYANLQSTFFNFYTKSDKKATFRLLNATLFYVSGC